MGLTLPVSAKDLEAAFERKAMRAHVRGCVDSTRVLLADYQHQGHPTDRPQRWTLKAFDAARTAGFRDLDDTDEAYFAIRVV